VVFVQRLDYDSALHIQLLPNHGYIYARPGSAVLTFCHVAAALASWLPTPFMKALRPHGQLILSYSP